MDYHDVLVDDASVLDTAQDGNPIDLQLPDEDPYQEILISDYVNIDNQENTEDVKELDEPVAMKEPDEPVAMKEPDEPVAMKEPDESVAMKEPDEPVAMKELEEPESMKDAEEMEAVKEPEETEGMKELKAVEEEDMKEMKEEEDMIELKEVEELNHVEEERVASVDMEDVMDKLDEDLERIVRISDELDRAIALKRESAAVVEANSEVSPDMNEAPTKEIVAQPERRPETENIYEELIIDGSMDRLPNEDDQVRQSIHYQYSFLSYQFSKWLNFWNESFCVSV